MSDSTFHLGLTMAGAVSAGCYTGGVMDYLLEIMDLWYEQKKNPTSEFEGLIPPHNVVIDAIGGASAGGMTSSMTVIELMKNKRTPITKPEDKDKAHLNTFYRSWVKMADGDSGPQTTTLYKMLDNTNDLELGIPSFLNSDPIDSIADNAFPKQGSLIQALHNLPDYVSRELELVLSLCMLSGIPMNVDFRTPLTKSIPNGSDSPKHSTWEHFTMGHFKLAPLYDSLDDKGYLWLNPFEKDSNGDHKGILKLATIATGAFPLGLKPRHFSKNHLTHEYLQTMAERIVFRRFGDDQDLALINQIKDNVKQIIASSTMPSGAKDPMLIAADKLPTGTFRFFQASAGSSTIYDIIHGDQFSEVRAAIQKELSRLPKFIDWANFAKSFEFTAVDGGTINNEPYGEVMEIVENRMQKDLASRGVDPDSLRNTHDEPFKMHGMVMIDPFPDVADNNPNNHKPLTDVRDVVGRLVGTLINQGRVKRHEMVRHMEEQNIKGVIFPMKYKTKVASDGQLTKGEACEPAIACDSLRAFGGFLSDDFREHDFFLGRNNARNFFRYWFSLPYDENNPDNCHPIHRDWTPEMVKIFKVKKGQDTYLPIIPDLYKVLEHKNLIETRSFDRFLDYDIPETPQLTIGNIQHSFEKPIRKRVKKLLNTLTTQRPKQEHSQEEDQKDPSPIATEWKNENLKSGWFSRWLTRVYLGIGRRALIKKLTKQIIGIILTDLDKKGLLKK